MSLIAIPHQINGKRRTSVRPKIVRDYLRESRKFSEQRPIRIALYSHDTVGLGHFRRNLLIAKSLANSGLGAHVLLIAGSVENRLFSPPPGVDCVTLPAISKGVDGCYETRSLGLSLKETLRIRSNIIHATVESFQPDVLIVDKVPRGIANELMRTLRWARDRSDIRCVLGLRDVLDSPETARREWRVADNDDAVRDYYDEVWIYGDPDVYDLVKECGLSETVKSKAKYVGYLDSSSSVEGTDAGALLESVLGTKVPSRFALCLVGGGEDGALLATTFAQAPLPPDMSGIIVTGPFMPESARKQLRDAAAANPRLHCLDFVAEIGELIRRADRVVTMGGYNTVCELLSYGKPTLVVPRVSPRQEQLIRGQRMSELGLLDMSHPDQLTPQSIGAWLAKTAPDPRPALERVRMNGLLVIENLLETFSRESGRQAIRGISM